MQISFEDFDKVEIRVGQVKSVEPFSEGKYSTHILQIDFGEFGIKKSLARLAPSYVGPELIGTQVLAVTNFAPRQIGKHMSEVLTLGVPNAEGNIILIRPETAAPLGVKIY